MHKIGSRRQQRAAPEGFTAIMYWWPPGGSIIQTGWGGLGSATNNFCGPGCIPFLMVFSFPIFTDRRLDLCNIQRTLAAQIPSIRDRCSHWKSNAPKPNILFLFSHTEKYPQTRIPSPTNPLHCCRPPLYYYCPEEICKPQN